jgi:hypothetical protein
MTAKLYQIWCEGDPRHDFTAAHLGQGKGASLKEACAEYAQNNPYFAQFMNLSRMTYKSCAVFDNEEAARVKCG